MSIYPRLSAVMFPVAVLALIGAGVWGYQEHQDKNSILIKAENQYQRAFHELSYQMEKLNDELGKTTALGDSSDHFRKRELIQIWRMTSEAQNEINQLPLTLVPFSKTEDFLDKMSNFAYRMSLRDLTKQPLSAEEKKTLQTLYERSGQLSKELRGIQTKVLNQHLRWMDVDMAIASEHTQTNNEIIDGLNKVDGKMGEYAEVQWGPSVLSLYEQRTNNMLSGQSMSAEEIRKKAQQFFGQQMELKVAENGQGTEYASYSVTGQTKDGRKLEMDFSKKGGNLLWFMNARDIGKARLSAQEATEKAHQFLREHRFSDMTPINYDRNDSSSNVTFAATQGGIVFYPSKVTVKVALDNGEVIGMQSSDYVYERIPDKVQKPKLTTQQAAQLLHDGFRSAPSRLAYIKNDFKERVLCYEYTAQVNGAHYRIYLNADSGIEEKMEKIKPVEASYDR